MEFAFKRAKICYMLIFGAVAGGLALILFAFLVVLLGQASIDASGRSFLFILLILMIIIGFIFGMVGVSVFRGNQMFITNKHVIQLIEKSPLVKSVNIIDLSSVEDASFTKTGFLQAFFNYGTFRLSTIGDETTYTFPYSDISRHDLNAVSKLITEVKEENKKKD